MMPTAVSLDPAGSMHAILPVDPALSQPTFTSRLRENLEANADRLRAQLGSLPRAEGVAVISGAEVPDGAGDTTPEPPPAPKLICAADALNNHYRARHAGTWAECKDPGCQTNATIIADKDLAALLTAAHTAVNSLDRFIQLHNPNGKDVKALKALCLALAPFDKQAQP